MVETRDRLRNSLFSPALCWTGWCSCWDRGCSQQWSTCQWRWNWSFEKLFWEQGCWWRELVQWQRGGTLFQVSKYWSNCSSSSEKKLKYFQTSEPRSPQAGGSLESENKHHQEYFIISLELLLTSVTQKREDKYFTCWICSAQFYNFTFWHERSTGNGVCDHYLQHYSFPLFPLVALSSTFLIELKRSVSYAWNKL